MRSKTATLMIRYKGGDGRWKRSLAARAGNGRIRSGYALIDGHQVKVDTFHYVVRYWAGDHTDYENVGRNASDAEARRQVLQQQWTVKKAATEVGLEIVEGPERKTLSERATAYITAKEHSGASEAAMQARLVTREFLATSKKRYVDELTTDDIARFHQELRKRGCSDRTVSNKHARLWSWLRFAGVDPSIMPPKPKYEVTLPTIYDRDTISTLLSDDDPYMHIVMLLALKCGLREQELMYLEWADIDWSEHTVRIQGKAHWDFKVKDKEQRDIPLPDDLLQELRRWRTRQDQRRRDCTSGGNHGELRQGLILPTGNGRPNTKLLLALKGLARRMKLNCGHCAGCRSNRRECKAYTLHRFRRTFLTISLRNGIDLRTVQAFAGHADLASTMRYLRPASSAEIRSKVNAISW